MKEKVLGDTQIRTMHERGEIKRAQQLRVDEVWVQKIKRKSWDNTKAHFSVAGDARTDEFFEWFGTNSGSRIKLQWEIVFRFQSVCSDSMFSFHAEPRQTLASWHMEYIGITWKRFLEFNFLRLIHPEVILEEFTFCAPQRERWSVPHATGTGTLFAIDEK